MECFASRPWLAGVCTRMAASLGGKIWGIRAAWLVLLAVKPLIAIAAYLLLAIVFELLPPPSSLGRSPREAWLESPELSRRARRIAALDRRLDRAAQARA